MKPHYLVNFFGLLLIITLMACRNSTSNFTTNTVINLDTSEVVQLRKENKELRREIYTRKKRAYALKKSFDSLSIESHVKDGLLKDRRLFPIMRFDKNGNCIK